MFASGAITIPDGLVGDSSPRSSLRIASLRPGACLRIKGTGSQYFLLVVDPETNLVVCQGGTKPVFRDRPRLTHLDGAGQSQQVHHPGEIRACYGMVFRFPGDDRPCLTSSTVPYSGIEWLDAIPVRHDAFQSIAHAYWGGQAVLGDPEYVAAYQDFLEIVPAALQKRAEEALQSFSPRARVLLLSVFQHAYQGGSLARVLDLFDYQEARHWSLAPPEVRGEPQTEADLRYWRELCMMAGHLIPAEFRSLQALAA
ncbi:MAG: hypothetical protein ACEQSB_04360 [Undibacterium sp.]